MENQEDHIERLIVRDDALVHQILNAVCVVLHSIVEIQFIIEEEPDGEVAILKEYGTSRAVFLLIEDKEVHLEQTD